MNVIGIDIGTSTICVNAVDSDSGEVIFSKTIPNRHDLTGRSFERLQEPNDIYLDAKSLIDEAMSKAAAGAVGVTGQMHGIVYLDKYGNALSPLYTWQDLTGNESSGSGLTFSEELAKMSGMQVASGFGCVTCYAHSKTADIPGDAACFCTIHDFVAMKLCGKSAPRVHSSDAASFGLFDIGKGGFDETACSAAGIIRYLPSVESGLKVLGEYRGAAVCIAIGDNQASFTGSVSTASNSLLVNIGTGGQVSFCADGHIVSPFLEERPWYDDKILTVGCSLCGGRAYAMLASFFEQCSIMSSGERPSDIYAAMERACEELPDRPLSVKTTFGGTRLEPDMTGSILDITTTNFTPASLIRGFINGIADELISFVPDSFRPGLLVGSGNGLRKNRLLRETFSERFSLPVLMTRHCEEASFGAALAAMVACGEKSSMEQAQKLVKYSE